MQLDRQTATVNPAGSPKITGTKPGENHDGIPFENFERLAKKLLNVPKDELDEKRTERGRKRRQEETS